MPAQSLSTYLCISSVLLVMGLFGILTRRNLIAMLISLELILNSASLNFVAFGHFTNLNAATSHVIVLFVIALAAAEVCIALSIILLLFRKNGSIDIENAKELKG